MPDVDLDAFKQSMRSGSTITPVTSPSGVMETATLSKSHASDEDLQDFAKAMAVTPQAQEPTLPAQPEQRNVLGGPQVPPSAQTSSIARQSFVDPAISLLGKGVVGVPQAAVGLMDIPTFGAAGKVAEELGVDFKTTQAIFDSLMSPEMQRDKAAVNDATGFLGTIKAAMLNPRVIPASVLESIPAMFAGQAAAGTTGVQGIASKLTTAIPQLGEAPLVAAAIGEGLISAGQTAEQVRGEEDDGLLNLKQVFASTASGAATALLGIMGGKLASRLGIADVDQLLVKEGNKNVRKILKEVVDPITGKTVKKWVDKTKFDILRDVIAGAISEGAFEELPQSLQEQVAQNIMQDRPWGEGVAEAGALGMLSGMVMGAGGNVIAQGTDTAQQDIEPPATETPAEQPTETPQTPETPVQAPEAPTPAYSPAPEGETAIDRLVEGANRPKEQGGRALGIKRESITAVQPNESTPSTEVTKQLSDVLGLEVVYYKAEEGSTLDSVNGTQNENTVYINSTAKDPAQVVFLHETAHRMEQDESIYRPLADAIDVLAKSDAKDKHTQYLTEVYKQRGLGAFRSDAEFVATVVESVGADPTFFTDLVEQIQATGNVEQVSAVQKALTKLAEIIDSIIVQVTGSNNTALSKYIEDANLDAANTAIKTALSQFATTQAKTVAEAEVTQPSEKPTATFAHFDDQTEVGRGQVAMYDIPNEKTGQVDTVPAETARKRGFEIPEIPSLPQVTRAIKGSGGIIQMSSDAMRGKLTASDIERQFKDAGYTVEVTEFTTDITQVAQGAKRFRVQVMKPDGTGNAGDSLAAKAYKAVFGTDQPISGKTLLEERVPAEQRVSTAIDFARGKQPTKITPLPPTGTSEPATQNTKAETPIPSQRTQEQPAGVLSVAQRAKQNAAREAWQNRNVKELNQMLKTDNGQIITSGKWKGFFTVETTEAEARRIQDAAKALGFNVVSTNRNGKSKLRIEHSEIGVAPEAEQKEQDLTQTAQYKRDQAEFEGTLLDEAERGQIPEDDPVWDKVSKDFKKQYQGIGKSSDKPFVMEDGTEAFRDAGVWRIRTTKGEWKTLSSRGRTARFKKILDETFPKEPVADQVPFSVKLPDNFEEAKDAAMEALEGRTYREHKLLKRLANAETTAGRTFDEGIRQRLNKRKYIQEPLEQARKDARKLLNERGPEVVYEEIMSLDERTYLKDASPQEEVEAVVHITKEFNRYGAEAKDQETKEYWFKKAADLITHYQSMRSVNLGRAVNAHKDFKEDLSLMGTARAKLQSLINKANDTKMERKAIERVQDAKDASQQALNEVSDTASKAEVKELQQRLNEERTLREKAESVARRLTKNSERHITEKYGTKAKFSKIRKSFASVEGKTMAGFIEALSEKGTPTAQFMAKREATGLTTEIRNGFKEALEGEWVARNDALPAGQAVDMAKLRNDLFGIVTESGNETLIDNFSELWGDATTRFDAETSKAQKKSHPVGKTPKLTKQMTEQELSRWAIENGRTPEQGALEWERIKAGLPTTGVRAETLRTNKSIQKALKAMDVRLRQLIKQHYSEQERTLDALIDQFVLEGMTKRGAEITAQAVETEFKRLMQLEGKKILDAAFMREETSKRLDIKDSQVAQNLLVHLANGVLSESKYYDAFAEAYGIKQMTPEIAEQINALQEKLIAANEGMPRNNATIDLLEFMDQTIGPSSKDAWWSIWYGNMLSAFSTHNRNIFDTAGNVFFNLLAEVAAPKNWKNAPFYFRGFAYGLKPAWAAASLTMRTGRNPARIRDKFSIRRSVLELNPFTGALSFLNEWKKIFRALSAEDTLFAVPAASAKSFALAAEMARQQSNSKLSANQIFAKADEILNHTSEKIKGYTEQAKSEGYSGKELQWRIFELSQLETGSNTHEMQYYDKHGNLKTKHVNITEAAHDWGGRVTYNYPSEGHLGELARKWRSLNIPDYIKLPLVPFTDIIANVLNAKLDYTPMGFIRLHQGMLQQDGTMRQIEGTERDALKAKIFMGGAAMIGLLAMGFSGLGDDEDDEDEGVSKWMPKFHGGGPKDRKKAYQLRESGWRPYSLEVGGKYIDYQLSPVAIPLGIVGNILDFYRYDKPKEKKNLSSEVAMMQAATYTIMRSANVITSMSFLSSITPLFTALEQAQDDPLMSARSIERVIARSLSVAVVPNLLKQLDRIRDPRVRETYSENPAQQFAAYLMREFPVVNLALKPKLNVLGEEARFDVAPIIGRHKPDKVWDLIADKGLFVSAPARWLPLYGKSYMNDDEYYHFSKVRGKDIRRQMEYYHDYLRDLPEERSKDLMRKIQSSATKRAKRSTFIYRLDHS